MNRLLFTTFIAITIIAFSGCSTKSAKTPDANINKCVGCEDLPDCVPGPYGDCLPKNKN